MWRWWRKEELRRPSPRVACYGVQRTPDCVICVLYTMTHTYSHTHIFVFDCCFLPENGVFSKNVLTHWWNTAFFIQFEKNLHNSLVSVKNSFHFFLFFHTLQNYIVHITFFGSNFNSAVLKTNIFLCILLSRQTKKFWAQFYCNFLNILNCFWIRS